jgi:hypothetical protein
MSTILDALRKVEENQRTRSADARARLLSFPTRPDVYSSRRRRPEWIIGAGLALVGFTAGVGLMLWGSRSPAPEEGQLASATGVDVASDKGLKPLVQPAVQPSPLPAVQAPTQPPVQPLPQVTAEIPPNAAPTPAPVEAPPVPQVAMPKLPSLIPPLPTPPETPVVPSSPAPAATPPEVRSAPVAPIPQQLIPEEGRRAARREERRARLAARRGALPSELRDLATATSDARSQSRPFPEARESIQPEAPAPRTEARTTKPPAPVPATATAPPNTSLSFLQWSPEADRRLAFIKVNGGPLTLAHEGDTVAGYTVVEIRRDAVELSAKGRSFTLQVEQ